MEVQDMRFIFKLLLFPITIIISLFVMACRFICQLSTIMLSIIAFLIFAIGLGTMVLLQDFSEGLKVMGLALLISPLGLPLIATFLVELLGAFNESLKTI